MTASTAFQCKGIYKNPLSMQICLSVTLLCIWGVCSFRSVSTSVYLLQDASLLLCPNRNSNPRHLQA